MAQAGISRRARLKGHRGFVGSIDWSPDGTRVASVSLESGLMVFDVEEPKKPHIALDGYNLISLAWRPGSQIIAASGTKLDLIDGETGEIHATGVNGTWSSHVSWSPDGSSMACASEGSTDIFDIDRDLVLRKQQTLRHGGGNTSLQWSPDANYLADYDGAGFCVWDAASGELIQRFAYSDVPQILAGWIRWSPDGQRLAFSNDQRIFVYDTQRWEHVVTIEGHEAWVPHAVWSSCGRVLASIGWDATVRLWSSTTWQPLAVLQVASEVMDKSNWLGIAFHPSEPVLATLSNNASEIDVWEIDVDRLLRTDRPQFTKYTTAKVVLVGDSGVGKTGLGYRLATGDFRDHSSTHGQHFWVADELAKVREDGTECDVVLWDLAGQSDYRLIHVLFLDDTDAAIVVFDPTRGSHALDAVDFWLNALRAGRTKPCSVILVAARVDRGAGGIAKEEIDAFLSSRNIDGELVTTSAATGEGVDLLTQRLREQIPWESMSATVTTTTFKAIKDLVLAVKDSGEEDGPMIMTAEELRASLADELEIETTTDSELWAAVHNLQVHGYVGILRTAAGERAILLAPELLNNMAASLILEARRNPVGLGAIDEGDVFAGTYHLPEAEKLPAPFGQVLVEAAIVLLLEHNVCFREALGGRDLLIFPELINEKPPILASEEDYLDSVTYVVEGNVQNVYASLVVMLGYTNVLTRVNQWQNRAEYEIDGVRIGFRQSRVRDDRVELTVYHKSTVDASKLRLFQGLIERFMQRRNISVRLYPRIVCECGFSLPTAQVIAFIERGSGFTFCPQSGDRIELPREAEPVSLTDQERSAVADQSEVAVHRTALTVAIAQLRAYIEGRDPRISCFISYAWGDPEHERWVEQTLAPDLEAAGLEIVLDRNVSLAGDDIARFVSRIDACDYILVVGTPSYLEGYENRSADVGRIVAAEVDLYSQRLTGTEQSKRTVIPLLRTGDRGSSFPPLLRGKVSVDLSSDTGYFGNMFDLALQLWGIEHSDPAVKDIREALAKLARHRAQTPSSIEPDRDLV